jgi:hypothetical protein
VRFHLSKTKSLFNTVAKVFEEKTSFTTFQYQPEFGAAFFNVSILLKHSSKTSQKFSPVD